ncbi:beta-galactosidase [Salipaludibacillus keqinensis]|uniref:Beta-galactosidase n=1 Tax=Salipaludibacillus keqinensis TaxID=2045207 RepID=A0A323TFT1_9BACI|nr:beta-galactosidase [Salipaludibacillus keqinensis]PYZ92764.1 beta-galactosidase [Salipaludibacillus keqinensis]
MYIGVDYYPEQWPRERWETDLQMMKELGINVIRIAEFGWSLMEPEEGTFDFTLYDEAIKRMHSYGFDVVLGTPTATPPAWLIEKYPEVLPVDDHGHVISFGARRHYTVNSEVYQLLSKRIVTEMAKRYGQHPAVIGWQVDNEYGHEKSDRSYGDIDQTAFQSWLKEKYDSLDALNERWGTVFWSQTYTRWSQIPVPRKVYQEHNPSLLLDFDRFCAEMYNRYNRMQVEVLRTFIPERQFITHNFVYTGLAQDQKEMAKDLDFISFDNYPVWGGLADPISPAAIARQHDLCRGTKNGKGYWVMEELSGAQGWSQIGYNPRPGHLKLWTYQAISRGAEAIVYFRWRAARYGTEQFCHGILDHDGKPRRKYDEVKEVIDSLSGFADEWIASDYKADVAFYHDPENEWAWQIQPHSDQFEYVKEYLRFYEPAHSLNTQANIIRDDEDLSRYKVVVVPIYFLTKKRFNDQLKDYVKNGGTVVFSYRTGVKDEDNVVTEETLPGDLAEMCGIEVPEYESLRADKSSHVNGQAGVLEGLSSDGEVWSDYIETTTADVLATYEDSWFQDKAAITKNNYGQGTVYYIGSGVESAMIRKLYTSIFQEAGVRSSETPEKVELVWRESSDQTYLAVLNHDVEESHKISLPEGEWSENSTGNSYSGELMIPRLGSMVLVKQK